MTCPFLFTKSPRPTIESLTFHRRRALLASFSRNADNDPPYRVHAVSKILVAFATKNGSTEVVARAVAETLRDGVMMDASSMSAVPGMFGRQWLGGT